MERFVNFVYRFLGSWWAIVLHTLWFAAWLVFDFNTEILALGVSLEAIFIWLVFLMAGHKAERQRDLQLQKMKTVETKMIAEDIKLDEKTTRQLAEIKSMQKELQEQMKAVKKELHKLQS